MRDRRYAWLLSASEQLDAELAGGKAAGLAKLLWLGADIPPTLVVTRDAMADTARGLDVTVARHQLPSRRLPSRVTDDLHEAWTALQAVADTTWGIIVRSSSTAEDVADSLAPGIFESVRVPGTFDDLITGIRAVWASAYTDDALAYASHHGRVSAHDMGVVVQPFIVGDLGGAIHTVDPSTDDPGVIVVSWSEAGASAILQGDRAGQTVTLPKDGNPETWDLPVGLTAAATAALRLERATERPLDLEFVVQGDTVLFLQLRSAPYEARWSADPRLVCGVSDERTLHSGKLVALRRSAEVLPSDAELYVVRPPAYARYVAAGCRMDDGLRDELAPLFDRLVTGGPVSVRPAYWSVRWSPDSLPQSGRLTTTDACLSHLELLWNHIRTHQLDDYSAEVAAICGNWLPVEASAVVAADPADARVRLDAVLGYPEGLESLPHDTLIIDAHHGEITERLIAHKARAVLEPRRSPAPVLIEERDKPCLDDRLALALAHAAAQLAHQSQATIRAEYLIVRLGDRAAPVLWQLDESRSSLVTSCFHVRAIADGGKTSPDALLVGRAVRIGDVEDLDRALDGPAGGQVALIDFSGLDPRARQQAVALVEKLLALALPVVIQASPLSHIAALLREYRVRSWAVPAIPSELTSGDLIEVVAVTPS